MCHNLLNHTLTGCHGKRKNSASDLQRILFTERWNGSVVALFMRPVKNTVTP
jgi:hypothetical protein